MAQVKVIFRTPSLMQRFLNKRDPSKECPDYLAYVEWFTDLEPAVPREDVLYRVRRQMQGNDRIGAVIPLLAIERTVHLIPNFGKKLLTNEQMVESFLKLINKDNNF